MSQQGAGAAPLRVVIDARLQSGRAGGIEGVVIGLAAGLSGLSGLSGRDDGPERFDFVTLAGSDDWLAPHVGGSVRLVPQAAPEQPSVSIARRIWRRRPWRAPVPSMPRVDPFVERLQPDVVHMPIQRGFLTAAPSIYHPHDLQHLHLPELFSPETRAWRDRWYGALCRQSSMVAVASTWTKGDVERAFDLPASRVRVVPLAPPLDAAASLTAEADADADAALVERFDLPPAFILYPAQTWPHKNHATLLRALAALRDEHGLRVPLVAPGFQNEHFPVLEALTAELGLTGQVQWLGFVTPPELRALFALARAVVIPSLFEAASGPLWEAFAAGTPAACSNVTSLPLQAGDAALVFDPLDVVGVAGAVRALWLDDALRARLVAAGRDRVGRFTWDRTARIFRAHYRRLAGRSLDDADRALLEADPGI